MVDFEKSRTKALQKIQASALFDEIAEQSATNNDSSRKIARTAYWKKLDEIEEWEAKPDALPSEATAKEQRLAVLHGELAALEAGLDAQAPAAADTAPTESQTAPALTRAIVVAANDAPAKRNRKPSWSTVAMPYMQAIYKQGRYKSATVFYNAMLSRSDMTDSPFTKLNGELYCKDAGTTVSQGSMGTKWKAIRTG